MDVVDTDAYEWQLDRMFGIWNSAIQEISDWIQAASTYRSTVVLDRVYNIEVVTLIFYSITTIMTEILEQYCFIKNN